MTERDRAAIRASFSFPNQELGFFGREELRSYAYVYAVLADISRSTSASGTLAALEVLLCDLRFGPGEPETSAALSGYSARSDVLWFRPYQVMGALDARPGSRRALALSREVREGRELRDAGIASATSVFSEGRSMDRLLHSFVGSPAWNDWRSAPIRVKSDSFPVAQRDAYFRLAGDHARAVFPFRGSLLVGRAGRGVVFLGVRQQEWLAGCSSEVRTRWLRSSPDLCRRVHIPPGPAVPLSELAARPLREMMKEDAKVYWHAARGLLQWHALPRPDPRRCRRATGYPPRPNDFEGLKLGRWIVPAAFISERRPFSSFESWAVKGAVRRGAGLPWVLLVGDSSPDAIEREVDHALTTDPDVMTRVRLWVVDAHLVDELVRRYPWVVEMAGAVRFPGLRNGSDVGMRIVQEVGEGAQDTAALAAFTMLSVPKMELDLLFAQFWVRTLLPLLPSRPWTLLRALYLVFRHDGRELRLRGSAALPQESVAYWADTFPSEFLGATKSSPWGECVPQRPAPEWWALARWLASWSAAGRSDVAAGVAAQIKGRVERGGGIGTSVEAAWDMLRMGPFGKTAPRAEGR